MKGRRNRRDCKDKDILALIQYIAEEDKLEKILENQQVIKTPVVRNGKQSTPGYMPEVWKGYAFQFHYRERLIRVSVKTGEACVELLEGMPITIRLCGEEMKLEDRIVHKI